MVLPVLTKYACSCQVKLRMDMERNKVLHYHTTTSIDLVGSLNQTRKISVDSQDNLMENSAIAHGTISTSHG